MAPSVEATSGGVSKSTGVPPHENGQRPVHSIVAKTTPVGAGSVRHPPFALQRRE